MVFEILQARTPDDEPDRLFPTPGPDKDTFVLEPGDGDDLLGYDCIGVIVEQLASGAKTELARVERITGALTITDSRFVFSCTEFQTGGGFTGGGPGGVLVAAAANAASRAMNVHKTRGYTLVGHIRYEWLGAVMAQDRHWGRSHNALKFTFEDPTPEGHIAILLIYPPNNQPAAAIALEVVRRAARARAQGQSESDRASLEAWAENPPSKPTSGGNGRSWILPD